MNYDTTCQELGLAPEYQSKEQCDRLEQWCHEHISLDIHYSGEDSKRYIRYLAALKKYCNTFLAHHQVDELDKPLPALNNQSTIEFAVKNGYHYFIMQHVNAISPNPLLDTTDKNKMTALHCAALSGYSHTLNTLLEKGANPLVTNNWDQYPIHSALVLTNHDRNLIQKKIDLFKCLQQRAPETIYKHDKSGNTVFHFMSIDDRFHELMSELLHNNDSGAKIFNKQLQYPIHCSILNNQTQSVKLLLAIDEVSSLKDSNDEVAAHHAARSKNSEIMNACFDSTQDLDIKNNNGETPLIIASKSENLEAIKILVEKGAHLHEEDEQGHSFIYYANESHSPELIHWLEEQGIREHVRPGN